MALVIVPSVRSFWSVHAQQCTQVILETLPGSPNTITSNEWDSDNDLAEIEQRGKAECQR